MEPGKITFSAHQDLDSPGEFDWDLKTEALEGDYEVTISTAALRNTKGEPWARFIDPRFE